MRPPYRSSEMINGEVLDVRCKISKTHKYKIVTIIVPINERIKAGDKVEIHVWR